MSEEKLVNFLKTGKGWSRLRTNVPEVFVLKLPAYRSSPKRFAVELNPVDGVGKPTERRGLILRSSAELEEFKELIHARADYLNQKLKMQAFLGFRADLVILEIV